jgi:hypothetical protein
MIISGTGQRREVIVQLQVDVEIEPMLGTHKWHKIVNNFHGSLDDVSIIFEYNWHMSGDPNTRECNLEALNIQLLLTFFSTRQLARVDYIIYPPSSRCF